jgi:hypothetical protein
MYNRYRSSDEIFDINKPDEIQFRERFIKILGFKSYTLRLSDLLNIKRIKEKLHKI